MSILRMGLLVACADDEPTLPPMAVAFGVLLKVYIDEAGYSSANAFAKAVESAQSLIVRCIHGKAGPPLERLQVWADALKLKGDRRADFVRSGWKARAEMHEAAKPWLDHIEEAMAEARKQLHEAEGNLAKLLAVNARLEARVKVLEDCLRKHRISLPPDA